MLKGKLETIYHREGVREWLTLYPELIDLDVLRLADFVEENELVSDFQSLNLTRVTEVPQDLKVYSCFNELYLKSDKSDWIERCLKQRPVQ